MANKFRADEIVYLPIFTRYSRVVRCLGNETYLLSDSRANGPLASGFFGTKAAEMEHLTGTEKFGKVSINCRFCGQIGQHFHIVDRKGNWHPEAESRELSI